MSEEHNVSGDQYTEAAVPPVVESNISQAEEAVNGESSNEKNIPLAALQSEREKRQQLEDELKVIKDHLSLMQSNQIHNQPKQKDDFEGLEDGDVMTVGEFKKLSSKITNQFKMSMDELKMTQKHPDYQEIVTKYLPEVLKNNPGLKNTLQATQDYELAYYLAKNSDNYRGETKKSKKSADAQRIVENSQKSGSLSSMGSTSPISQAKRYKDMSDTEFKELVQRNLG